MSIPLPAAIHSLFTRTDGSPRFTMTVPRRFLADPGVHLLVDRERRGIGFAYATRCLLDGLLRDGDLFVDIGAHWGIMSLQAATGGEVQVLAVEALADNLPHLKRWVAENRLDHRIEVVFAVAAESPRR
ncbi:MAG TPA: hypothetical protein HPQ04_16385, partial [Rhodospirillaceae bacterium]|nr:hypothetical protein [Rhodospirillaceae bacterium]